MDMTTGRDPYIVLGVHRRASPAEISRAYRRAARTTHPDSGDTGSDERFRAITDAYDELRDTRRRDAYDRSHPVDVPRAPEPMGVAVRYAAPGSQHLVLGREPATPAAEARADDVLRLIRSFLRITGA